jgi:type IV pilus biogenesis protein CpaD/CtpE
LYNILICDILIIVEIGGMRMSETQSKKSTQYKNRYNAANYDSLRIVIPKGRKQAVEAHAKGKGESVNGLVNSLLRADMGLTEDEWRHTDEP